METTAVRVMLKAAGVAFWLLSLGLTAAIVWDYVGAQGAIPCGLAILAVVGSAVGGVVAHRRWDSGSRRLAAVCFLFCALGEAYLVPLEIGYWASQVQQRAEDREMADARHKAKLSEFKNLATKSWGETIKGSDEIQAERAVELSRLVTYQNDKGIKGSTKPLGVWTRDCTDHDHWAFRGGHCTKFVEMGADLARAMAAEGARGQLAESSSRETSSPVSDPAAGNKWFARRVGGLDIGAWSDLFMVSGVILLGFFRDATLLLTFAPWPPGSGQKSGHASHDDVTLTSPRVGVRVADRKGDSHPDTDTDTDTGGCQGDMHNANMTVSGSLPNVSVKSATLTHTDTKNQHVSHNVSPFVSVKSATLTDNPDMSESAALTRVRPVSLTVVRGGAVSLTAMAETMTVSGIAKLKGVSERTIHRRLAAERAANSPSLHPAKGANRPKKGA